MTSKFSLRSEADAESPNPTNVGGQAIMEGVLMRAPGSLAIACRRRDGSITLRERSMPLRPEGPWRLPFLRGVHTLVSSIRLGHQALTWSASLLEEDVAAEEKASAEKASAKKAAAEKASAEKATNEENVPSPNATNATSRPSAKGPSSVAMLALGAVAPLLLETSDEPTDAAPRAVDTPHETTHETPAPREEPDAPRSESAGSGLLMFVPLAFAVFLFIALPQLVAEGINAGLGLGLAVTAPLFQAITGGSKLVIVVSYLALIRLIPDVYRVFQYHGAEHKAISTYERGQPLELAHARPTTALHARCGTTFIIMVAFVSVVLFSVAGAFLPPIPGPRAAQSALFFLLKLPLFPVVAGLTFELQRVFARYCSTGPLQFVLWPGFLVQKITTAPPDDDQLEVALASLRSALARASTSLPADHPDRSFSSFGVLAADPAYAGLLSGAPRAGAAS